MANVVIRPLQTMAEYTAAYALQMETWGKEQSIVTNQMVVTDRIGGLVLGAFDPHGQLVGFSYGVPAVDEGEPYLWSDLLVIRRDLRGQGLGARLKWAQRATALERGFRRIRWTYDPLQAVNARLNLGTLGATGGAYVEDMYGEMPDDLNRGLPTDRLVVCWDLTSERVSALAAGASGALNRAPAMPVTIRLEGETPAPVESNPEAPAVLTPIPMSIDQIRRADPALALRWRTVMRQVLTRHFASGYVIHGVAAMEPGPMAYVLLRESGR